MKNASLVLVADDEPRITKLVAATLREEEYRVITADTGAEAIRIAEELRPDLALLDLVLPDLDGIEVMRQLRESRPIPIILLTGVSSATDKARGLDLGADDYIAKPFHPDELAARVRAVLRRSEGPGPPQGIVPMGEYEVDLERRVLRHGSAAVPMSRTEWMLLQYLASNAGKVVLHSELLSKVWGPAYHDDVQYLRVWISRVRRKLGTASGEAGPILTYPGIGYSLVADSGATMDAGEPERGVAAGSRS